jgi:multimeric flavodoxin WrbA
MKTLILNGSPRKHGDTVSLIGKMVESLNGEVYSFSAYYDNISPCIDCRHCWKNKGCIIDDDMQQVYSLLDEVDNVILASPIYFSELTGSLLGMLSRLQVYYAARMIRRDKHFKLKRKNGVIILVGGGDGSFEPALKTAKILFKQMNVSLNDTIISHNTNTTPAIKDYKALSKLEKTVEKLNV